MRWVKDKVAKVPGEAFPMALAYSRWEVDEVVVEELLRNLLLALAMVTLVTLLLLADIRSCIFVLASVLLTIVDTVGLMYFWGLTINITGGTNLVISIGLCVDYSAHIAHAFMVAKGSRNDRMKQTLTCIGPAVLNGGISTFLAFVLLSMSKSIIFLTFFKVFFLVVVFGLFHGLLFLPVVLSLFGPKSMGKPGFARTSSLRDWSADGGSKEEINLN